MVITGGTSGMGLATARYLLDGGARVLVTGRTKAALDAARAELGPNAIVMESDATSIGDIDALAQRVQSEFAAIDLLFVNAGATRWVPFEATTEAVYDELLAVNAKAAYFTVQKLAPLMGEGGAVVLDHFGRECQRHSPRQRLLGRQGSAAFDGAHPGNRASAARYSRQRCQSGPNRHCGPDQVDAPG